MFQIIEYIKFLLKSTNQHGVHSPFIYDLVTKCFYDSNQYDAYSKITSYRASLLKNNQSIEITDLGSGSRVFNSNKRSIKAIVKTSGSTKKRSRILFRLAQYFRFKQSLELGTSLGVATHALALGHSENNITSLEGCPNLSEFTIQHLKQHSIKNVSIVTGDISNTISNLKSDVFDFIFFDANHNKEATLSYFNSLVNKAHNDSVFIFDDIHWSKGMRSAWNIIKEHPKVTVTIDTFFWGFVFFRKEQAKENFTIRL